MTITGNEHPPLSPEAREIIADLVRAGEAVIANLNGADPAHAIDALERAITDARELIGEPIRAGFR